MARPKKRATEPTTPNASSFLDALRFVGSITKDAGPINETHIYLGANWACTYNGIIAAGCPIKEDIYACPQSKLIIEALAKCGEHISFTQLDNNRLSVKSGKFKAIVPCIDPSLLAIATPDPPVAMINDQFKEGMQAVGVLSNENGQRIVIASILMTGQTLISTNGNVIFEYWHGIDLPPNIALPKALVEPLVKTSKKLSKFGFSQSSVTFYFEDDSWLRSQLYQEQWPDISGILDRPTNAWPIPVDFFKAVQSVAPFSKAFLYSRNGSLHSHTEINVGASFECDGLPSGLTFSIQQMALIKPWAETIDFFVTTIDGEKCFAVFGKNMRCLIAGIK